MGSSSGTIDAALLEAVPFPRAFLQLARGLTERLIDGSIRIVAVGVSRRVSGDHDAPSRSVEIDPNGVVAAVTMMAVRQIDGDMAGDDAWGHRLELRYVVADTLTSCIAVGPVAESDLERNKHAQGASTPHAALGAAF
jgi:hypothetical protein